MPVIWCSPMAPSWLLGRLVGIRCHFSCIKLTPNGPSMISRVTFIQGDQELKDVCQFILVVFYDSFLHFYSCHTWPNSIATFKWLNFYYKINFGPESTCSLLCSRILDFYEISLDFFTMTGNTTGIKGFGKQIVSA